MKNTLEIQSGKNFIRPMSSLSVVKVIMEKHPHIGQKTHIQSLYQKMNIVWLRS